MESTENVKTLTEAVDKFLDDGWDDLTYEQQNKLIEELKKINNKVKEELTKLNET